MLRALLAAAVLAAATAAAQPPAPDFLVQPLRKARPFGMEMYVAEAQIGTPPQPLTVSFETAIDLSFVPSRSCQDPVCQAHKQYDSAASSTFEEDGTPFDMISTVNVSGVQARDTLHLAGVSVANVTFGSATHMTGADYALYLPNDGSYALGLRGQLLDQLQQQGLIQRRLVGVYLAHFPDAGAAVHDGVLTLGGISDDHYSGELHYLDVLPGSDSWSVRLDNVSVAGVAGPPLCGQDGCPAALISSSPYFITSLERTRQIADAVGARPLATPGAYWVDCTRLHELPTLTVTVAGRAVSFTGREYTLVSQQAGGLQLCVLGVLGIADVQGDAWMLGAFFMQKVYTVFDQENLRVGFADIKH